MGSSVLLPPKLSRFQGGPVFFYWVGRDYLSYFIYQNYLPRAGLVFKAMLVRFVSFNEGPEEGGKKDPKGVGEILRHVWRQCCFVFPHPDTVSVLEEAAILKTKMPCRLPPLSQGMVKALTLNTHTHTHYTMIARAVP